MLLLAALACRPPPLAPAAGERPLNVWRVEEGRRVSHLIGTCHLPIPLEAVLPPPHDQLLAGAKTIVIEADITSLDPTLILTSLWMERRLSKQLPHYGWLGLTQQLHPFPAPILDQMPAWAVVQLRGVDIEAAMERRAAGTRTDPAGFLDKTILETATAAGAVPVFLETAAEQLAMLSAQEDVFIAQLDPRQRSVSDALTVSVKSLCLDGDLAAFEDHARTPETAGFYEVLLDERNARWVPRLLPLFEEGDAVVAVGVGHMVGARGLVSQLTEAGYTVERLHGTPSTTEGTFSESEAVGFVPPDGLRLERIDAWHEGLAGVISQRICSPDSPVGACFVTDPAGCTQQVDADLRMCLEQLGDDLPPLSTGAPVHLTLAGCAGSRIIFDAVVNDRIADDPVCEQFSGALPL